MALQTSSSSSTLHYVFKVRQLSRVDNQFHWGDVYDHLISTTIFGTRWADEDDHGSSSLSLRLIRLDFKSTIYNASDDDHIGLPKTQFMPSLPKFGNKLIDFANRPGSSLLQSSNRKEIKVSTFKLDTHLSSLAKTLEIQPPSSSIRILLLFSQSYFRWKTK